MTDIKGLVEEARGFISGSDPTSARTTLIRDLADRLERAEKVIALAVDELGTLDILLGVKRSTTKMRRILSSYETTKTENGSES